MLRLDLSENMLARASADTSDVAVRYARADLETLKLPEGEFDLAYSSLALHYAEDFGRLARAVLLAFDPRAHFVFTIEHPIHMASTRPGWLVREDGRTAWPVDNYAVEGARTTVWLVRSVVEQHRTLGTTLNTLITSAFAIRGIQEWRPTPEQIATRPAPAEEMERPMLVLISAQR